MAEYITSRLGDLRGEEQAKARALVEEAQQSEFLKTNSLPGEDDRQFVYHGEDLIGFYSPFKQQLLARTYWRAGPLYLSPQYRGQGHMACVLQEFFAHHEPGLAWIDEDNKASQRLYVGLGFKRHSQHPGKGGRAGWWYTNDAQVTPAPNLDLPVSKPARFTTW